MRAFPSTCWRKFSVRTETSARRSTLASTVLSCVHSDPSRRGACRALASARPNAGLLALGPAWFLIRDAVLGLGAAQGRGCRDRAALRHVHGTRKVTIADPDGNDLAFKHNST